MAGGVFSGAKLNAMTIRESANDGSDFTNPDADYRKLFLGEDGQLHVKDSAGTVTDIGTGSGAPTDAEYVVTASNGSLSAEKVVSAPASGGVIPLIVRKAADETVNNSAVLQNDDVLLFAIGASEVWHFEAFLFFSSGTTPDFKAAFTVPASAALTWWAVESFNETGVSWGNSTIVASGTARAFEGAGAGTKRGMHIIGIVANSTNAGNVTLQWAQNTQNSSDTIVYANSIIRATKLA